MCWSTFILREYIPAQGYMVVVRRYGCSKGLCTDLERHWLAAERIDHDPLAIDLTERSDAETGACRL